MPARSAAIGCHSSQHSGKDTLRPRLPSQSLRVWRGTHRGHVFMCLAGELRQTGTPGLLVAPRMLQVNTNTKVSSYLYDVFHWKGRGGLFVSCAYLGFTCHHRNGQTQELSSLNEQKGTLGIKEASGPAMVLTRWLLAGLEIYPAPESIAPWRGQGHIYFSMSGHKFHHRRRLRLFGFINTKTSVSQQMPPRRWKGKPYTVRKYS